MKKYFSSFVLFASLFLPAMLGLFSCSNKDNNPPYVGNWLMYGNTSRGDSVYLTKALLTLNVSNFGYIQQIRNNATGAWLNYVGQTGYLAVTGNSLKIQFTSLGIAPIDSLTGYPNGIITYYGPSDSTFTTLLNSIGGNVDLNGSYSISGNELTLKIDLNNNGSTNDPGETSIYIRQ